MIVVQRIDWDLKRNIHLILIREFGTVNTFPYRHVGEWIYLDAVRISRYVWVLPYVPLD
jgi:hypothetical protein